MSSRMHFLTMHHNDCIITFPYRRSARNSRSQETLGPVRLIYSPPFAPSSVLHPPGPAQGLRGAPEEPVSQERRRARPGGLRGHRRPPVGVEDPGDDLQNPRQVAGRDRGALRGQPGPPEAPPRKFCAQGRNLEAAGMWINKNGRTKKRPLVPKS